IRGVLNSLAPISCMLSRCRPRKMLSSWASPFCAAALSSPNRALARSASRSPLASDRSTCFARASRAGVATCSTIMELQPSTRPEQTVSTATACHSLTCSPAGEVHSRQSLPLPASASRPGEYILDPPPAPLSQIATGRAARHTKGMADFGHALLELHRYDASSLARRAHLLPLDDEAPARRHRWHDARLPVHHRRHGALPGGGHGHHVVPRLELRQVEPHGPSLDRHLRRNRPRVVAGLRLAPPHGHRAVDVVRDAQLHADLPERAQLLGPRDDHGDVHRIAGGIAVRLPVHADLLAPHVG